MVHALDQMAERYREDFSPPVFATIRAGLVEREARADRKAKVERVLQRATATLKTERGHVKDWRLKGGGFRLMAAGLETSFRLREKSDGRGSRASDGRQLPYVAAARERSLVPCAADRGAVWQSPRALQAPSRGARRMSWRISQLRAASHHPERRPVRLPPGDGAPPSHHPAVSRRPAASGDGRSAPVSTTKSRGISSVEFTRSGSSRT